MLYLRVGSRASAHFEGQALGDTMPPERSRSDERSPSPATNTRGRLPPSKLTEENALSPTESETEPLVRIYSQVGGHVSAFRPGKAESKAARTVLIRQTWISTIAPEVASSPAVVKQRQLLFFFHLQKRGRSSSSVIKKKTRSQG